MSVELIELCVVSAEIDNEKFWKYPFKAIRSIKAMTEFTILDTSPMAIPTGGGHPIRTSRKTRLADMEVVRNADFGVNDTRLQTICHLGTLLHVGDSALGYDLTSAVFNDNDLEPLQQAGITLPDVILVKKQYPRRLQKRTRNWKLKKMEGVEQAPLRPQELAQQEEDYEQFLNDVEEDQLLREQINVYKDDTTITKKEMDGMEVEEDDAPIIPLHELLDDLHMETTANDSQVLTADQANQIPAWELEEL